MEDQLWKWHPKRWIRRYLEEIGQDRLSVMGYDKEVLLAGVQGSKGDAKLSDYAMIPLSPAYHLVEPFILRTKKLRSQGFFGRR